MAKRKLQRFAEMKDFNNVFDPLPYKNNQKHELAGEWRARFFKNKNPVILELGCGRGEYTIELARFYPEKNFVGIDVKGARLWRGAKTAIQEDIFNAAFIRTQIERLELYFSPGEADEIWITFPDPQLKREREKKRLTAPGLLKLYASILKPEGIIHLKTDNEDLYHYTIYVLNQINAELLYSTDDLYHSGLSGMDLEIKTTYEKKYLEQGMNICYIRFRV